MSSIEEKNEIIKKTYYDRAGYGSIRKPIKTQRIEIILLHQKMLEMGFIKMLEIKDQAKNNPLE